MSNALGELKNYLDDGGGGGGGSSIIESVELKYDEDGEPYLLVVQRIPINKKKQFKFSYQCKIVEDVNFVIQGELPFYLKIPDKASWFDLSVNGFEEFRAAVTQVTQCSFEIELPNENKFPAFAKIILSRSTQMSSLTNEHLREVFNQTWTKLHEALVNFLKSNQNLLVEHEDKSNG